MLPEVSWSIREKPLVVPSPGIDGTPNGTIDASGICNAFA